MSFIKNAELTDCATLIRARKYGLMKIILQELEGELKTQGYILCLLHCPEFIVWNECCLISTRV